MNISAVSVFWALVLGVLSYFIAQLVFNGVISALIGVVVAGLVLFGGRRW